MYSVFVFSKGLVYVVNEATETLPLLINRVESLSESPHVIAYSTFIDFFAT